MGHASTRGCRPCVRPRAGTDNRQTSTAPRLGAAAGPPEGGGPSAHAWSDDGRLLATAGPRRVRVSDGSVSTDVSAVGRINDVSIVRLDDRRWRLFVAGFGGLEIFDGVSSDASTTDGRATRATILWPARCIVVVAAHAGSAHDGSQRVAFAALDGEVMVCRVTGVDAAVVEEFSRLVPGRVTSLAISDQTLVAACWDGAVVCWGPSPETPPQTERWRHASDGETSDMGPRFVALSRDDAYVALTTRRADAGRAAATVLDARSGAEVYVVRCASRVAPRGLCALAATAAHQARFAVAVEEEQDAPPPPRGASERRASLLVCDWPVDGAADGDKRRRTAALEGDGCRGVYLDVVRNTLADAAPDDEGAARQGAVLHDDAATLMPARGSSRCVLCVRRTAAALVAWVGDWPDDAASSTAGAFESTVALPLTSVPRLAAFVGGFARGRGCVFVFAAGDQTLLCAPRADVARPLPRRFDTLRELEVRFAASPRERREPDF
ncbi:hypothetical protein M885DRAFT_534033 [Pelagophyceae sp. CCMP2097]|nr:hypothetical protein M885DRAFT_534033 [Pelagophyceae sp. CCMP2097]